MPRLMIHAAIEIVVALAVLAADAVCYGQVCQIRCQAARMSHMGTAFPIGTTKTGDWYFLTAGHNAVGTSDAFIEIGGEWRRATKVSQTLNQWVDVAAYTLRYDGKVTCYPLMEDNPPLGTHATFYGYGGGNFRRVEAQITRNGFDGWKITLDRPSVPGDSGGPVLVNGKVAGIVVATDDVRCYATSVRTVHRWLENLEQIAANPQQPPAVAGVGVGANVGGFGVGVGIGGYCGPNGCYPPRRIPPPRYMPPAQPQGPALPPPSQPDPFVEPKPQEPQPPAQPPSQDIAVIIRAELQALAASGALKGEPGRDGKDGKDGAPGEKGDRGEPGAGVNPSWILSVNARLQQLETENARLKAGFYVQHIDVNGKSQTDIVEPGGTLVIQQSPVKVKAAE